MPGLKVGVQLASLRAPLLQGLEWASRMGASAVEIDARHMLRPQDMSDTAIRQLRKKLDDLNLRVCALGFRTRNGYHVVDRLEQRVEATKAAMDLAYRLGANVVVNQIGQVPADRKGPDWDTLIDVLTELGKHAQRSGAFLAAETGTESGEDLRALIDALPEGSLSVTLNPGNLIVQRFSAEEAIRCLRDHILYVHAKDGVQDLARGRGVEVPLGRGSADFPTLLGMLEECSYRGYFTVERENSSDPLSEVAAAVEFLKQL